LANGSYSWEVPTGWTITAGANTNAIQVTAGANGGNIVAHEVNGCADLRDTITVTSKAPTIPGAVGGDNTVCTGINSTLLTLGGQNGNVISWLSSTNGIIWNPVANTAATYTAQNLTNTTQFAVVVQNGPTCRLDTSTTALVTVDPKSVGGAPDPSSSSFCSGQTVDALLTLKGSTGTVTNWQLSPNNSSWSNTAPANTTPTYPVRGVTSDTWYRAIVKSGVCAPDTSDVAVVRYVNVPFPAAAYDPANAVICYGDSIKLNAAITIGTSYAWSPTATLRNQGNGTIPSLPLSLQASAKPLSTTNYILTVLNAGCPNALRDTFKIKVTPPIKVSAGNDTAVVIGQLLQLNATVNDPAANQFTWTPSFGLNRTNIPNPTAILYTENAPFVIYTVRATNADGCFGTDDIKVKVFLTPPDIFVPNAFSPNGDGRNDVIRPVCVGITQLNFFRLYNRWGQMVFSTTEINKGWDGTLGGKLQASGTFVYTAQGIDYMGKALTKKGVVVLIR
jgi:gliding motility-associated-like protein